MSKIQKILRKKKKFPCPNPLFEKWLMEWKAAAAEKGLKTQFIFGKALTSLRRYPLPLASGREAKILEFFGDKICLMLDKKLEEYKQQQTVSSNVPISVPSVSSVNDFYNSNTGCSEENNISPELENGGLSVAVNEELNFINNEGVCLNEVSSQSQSASLNENSFTLYPGSFDVILCVDSCETSAGHGKTKKQFLGELQKHKVDFEVRKINVGDFLWIAREKVSDLQTAARELVLNYVVERKRMDDLSHSIKDGRFREQKFRLKNCGVKQPIYLVEYHKGYQYGGIPESTLEQAVVNTQVIDRFIIKRTRDVKESVLYLSLMTKYLQNLYQMKTLKSGSREAVKNSFSSDIYMTFKEFNTISIKNKRLTVGEMFAKHLLQFHGVSVDRAASVVQQYPTVFRLLRQFDSCSSEKEKIETISSLKFGKSQRPFGQLLSATVQQFYCTRGPLP